MTSDRGPAPPRPFRADGRLLVCAVTPIGSLTPTRLADLLAAGVDFVQLRDRTASDRAFEGFLAQVDAEFPKALRRVLVNDRVALALRYPIAGVHLPETGLPVEEARALGDLRGGRWLVGRSVHGAADAVRAAAAGADYVLLGPVRPTGAKRRALPPGELAAAARDCPVPVWAVGGLNPGTLDAVRGTGVRGVAAIRALADPGRSAAFVAALRSREPISVRPARSPVAGPPRSPEDRLRESGRRSSPATIAGRPRAGAPAVVKFGRAEERMRTPARRRPATPASGQTLSEPGERVPAGIRRRAASPTIGPPRGRGAGGPSPARRVVVGLAVGVLGGGGLAPVAAAPAQPPANEELEQAAERRFLSAEQFYRGGRQAQALRDYETVLEAMADSRLADDAALRIAVHRFEVEGNPAAAEEMAERMLAEFPAGDAIPGAHHLLGRIAAESVPPRPEDAAAEFERALTAAGPEGSDWAFPALLGIARAAAARGDDEAAAGALLSALYETAASGTAERRRFEARYDLALALARARREDGALAELAPLRADLLRRLRDGGRVPTAGPAAEGAPAPAAAESPPSAGEAGGEGDRGEEWVAGLARRAEALSLLIARFRDPRGPAWRFAGSVRPPRELDEPLGLRLAGDRIQVLDRDTRELQIFTESGEFRRAVSMRNPRGLALDRLLAAEGESAESAAVVAAEDLLVVGGNGLTLRAPGRDGDPEPLRRIRAAAVTPEGFWVWDDRRKQVLRFARSGMFLGPRPHPRLERVRRIARHPRGALLVVEERQGVLGFDAEGHRLFHRPVGGALAEPVDLVFDSLGRLYLLDRAGPQVLIHDLDFAEVATLSGAVFGGAVRRPVSLDVGADGSLFLLDEATESVGVLR